MKIESLIKAADSVNAICEKESQSIIDIVKEIKSEYQGIVFDMTDICKICVDSITNNNAIPSAYGIYVFMTSDAITLTSNMNPKKSYKNKKGEKKEEKYAKIKKGEFKKHDAGICLYLGKSEDLNDRIIKHTISAHGSTSSLKLYFKQRKMLKSKLTLYWFPLKNELEEHSALILSEIERILHKQLNPIIGSARVG